MPIIKYPKVVHKYYIYDPNVGDEFGGLRVKQDDDKKGRYVLAVQNQVQYWIDQGLIGDKPVGEISGSHKKLLAQITRGRSENPDEDPKRLPKYDRKTQSGAPVFAGQAASMARSKKARDRQKAKNRGKPAAKSATAAPKPTTPPPASTPR